MPAKNTRKRPRAAVLKALEVSGGILHPAAQALGVNRCTLRSWISDDAELRAAAEGFREETLDIAESHLFAAIQAGDLPSIRFFLRTVGKARGYGERLVLAGDPARPVVVEGGTSAREILLERLSKMAANMEAAEADDAEADTVQVPALPRRH